MRSYWFNLQAEKIELPRDPQNLYNDLPTHNSMLRTNMKRQMSSRVKTRSLSKQETKNNLPPYLTELTSHTPQMLSIKPNENGAYSLVIDPAFKQTQFFDDQALIATVIMIDKMLIVACFVDSIILSANSHVECEKLYIKYADVSADKTKQQTTIHDTHQETQLKHVVLAGSYHFTTGAIVECENFALNADASLLAQLFMVKSAQVSIAGDVDVTELHLNASNSIDVGNKSKIKAKRAVFTAAQSLMMDNANCVFDDFFAKAKKLTIQGKLTVKNECALLAETSCQISENTKLSANSIILSGYKMSEDKYTPTPMQKLTVANKTLFKGKKSIHLNASTLVYDGQLDGRRIEMQGKNISLLSHFMTKKSAEFIIEASNSLQIENEDNISVKQMVLRSQNLLLSGSIEASDVFLLQTKSLDILDSSRIGCRDNFIIQADVGNISGLLVSSKNILATFKDRVKINGTARLRANNDLLLQAREIIVLGMLENKGSKLQLLATTKLHVGEQAQIFADNEIVLKTSRASLHGKMNGSQLSVIADQVSVEKNVTISADNVNLVLKGLLQVAGAITCQQDLNIKSSDINIKKSAHIQTDKLTIKTGGLYSRGSVKSGLMMLTADRKVILENEAMLECQGGHITAEKLHVYGQLRSNNPITLKNSSKSRAQLILNVKDSVSIDLNGELACETDLHVYADSFWNRGKVWSSKRVAIAVDTVCINGFVSADSLANVIRAVNSRMSGESLSIVAMCVVNAPTCMLIGTNFLSVSSLVHIDVCGISTAYTTSIKTIVPILFANASFPNPAKIFKVMNDVCQGDFSALDPGAGIDNYYECWANRIMTLSSYWSLILPGFSAAIQTGANLINVALQTRSIYQQVTKLYRSYEYDHIHTRDIIPIIVTSTSLVETGIKAYTSALKAWEQHFSQNSEWSVQLNPEIPDIDGNLVLSLLGCAVSMFAPSTNIKSVAEISLFSQEVSWSVSHYSVFSYRSALSTQTGFLVTHTSLCSEIDNGNIKASQILMNVNHLFQGGKWQSNNVAVHAATLLEQGKDGAIESQKGTLHTPIFSQSGKTDIDTGNVVITELHEQTATASSHYSYNTRFRAKRQRLASECEFKGAIVDVEMLEQNDKNQEGLKITENSVYSSKTIDQQSGQITIKDSYVSTDKLTKQGDIEVQSSVLKVTEQGVISGNTTLKNALVQGEGNLDFTADGKLTAGNALVTAKNINYESQGEIKQDVGFIAEQTLNTSQTSTFAGDGNLMLKSKNGDLTGAVTTKTLTAEISEMNDFNDLVQGTGQYQHIQPTDNLTAITDKSFTLDKTLQRDCGIEVIAKSVDINKDAESQGQLAFTATDGDVNINANLRSQDAIVLNSMTNDINMGNNNTSSKVVVVSAQNNINHNGGNTNGEQVFLQTKEGDLNNNGGSIRASEYLQADIAKNIHNEANVSSFSNGHSNINIWQQGVLEGGTGANHDGVGALIHAGGMLVIDASTIHSVGSNEIVADKGIVSTSQTNTFINYNDGHGNYGLTTQFAPASIISDNGRNVLVSDNGHINSVATNFTAKEGTDLVAKEKVVLDHVVLVDEQHSHKKNLFHDKKVDTTHETDVATAIVNTGGGDIRIHSMESDVIGNGLIISNPQGTTLIKGVNVILSNPTLNHSIVETEKRISLSLCGHTIGGSDEPIIQMDPTVQHIRNLAQSHHVDEVGLNAMNTAVGISNAVNTFSAAAASGQVIEAIANQVGLSTTPSIGVNFTTTKSEQHYQTAGSSRIDTAELILIADDKVTLNNVPTHAVKAAVQANLFSVNGQALHSSSHFRENTVTATTSGPGKVDVGVSSTRFNDQAITYATGTFQVDESLHVDVNGFSLNNALVDVGNISGRADTLSLTSIPNSYESSSKSFSVATTGAVSYHHGHSEQTSLPNPTQLHVNDSIDDDIKVGTAYLTGAKITTDGANQLNSTEIVANPVTTTSSTSNKGIGGNPNALFNNTNANKKITTFNISDIGGKRVEQQDSVIYGAQGTKINSSVDGNLHTTSDDGHQVISNTSRKRIAEIPLPTEDNFKRLKTTLDILSPNTTMKNPQQAQWDILLKKYPNESEDSLKQKALLSHFFSQQVYASDCGEEAVTEKGYLLVGIYKDSRTDSTVAVYINPTNNQGYIAFTGSVKKAWITDDVDIAVGKAPASILKTDMQMFIQQQLTQHTDINFSFTGHSRGATQASIASDMYHLPAMVFENPGAAQHLGYQFNDVVSFQSMPDVINSIDKIFLTPYNYGTRIQLPSTPVQQATNAGLQVISNLLHTPVSALTTFGAQTYNAHNNKGIGNNVETLLEQATDERRKSHGNSI